MGGEAGVGKTRLTAELVARSAAEDDLPAALKSAQLSIEIGEKLVAANPKDAGARKVLAESYVEKLGDGELAAGLGHLGDAGWELVGFEKGRFVFKREK